MRPRGHRRQVLLFLAAVLFPSLVLVGLSIRMIGQDRELAERRREVERRRALEQIRKDLADRLDRIRLEEFGYLAKRDALERPLSYQNPAVALVARIEQGKLVLPWERDPRAARARDLLAQPPFGGLVRAGEQEEFVAGRPQAALRYYERAAGAASHPEQAGYARHLQARALEKLGRRKQAIELFRAVHALPPETVDDEGVPLKLAAAERLLEAGVDHKAVLETVRRVAAMPLSPPGCYLALRVTEALIRSAPAAGDREAASEVQRRLHGQSKRMEQAEALETDFAALRLRPNAWTPYGDEPWLASVAPAGWPPAVIAVRAEPVFSALGSAWDSPFWRSPRFFTEGPGDLLGDTFPGLKAALAAREESPVPGSSRPALLFYYVALAVVAGATGFSAWLLWRDLQREVLLAEVRSQFVAGVSHELKTPLTAIRMFAETLQMGRSNDPNTQAEYLETIVGECERLTRLVDDVLTFSKIERGKKQYQFRPARLEEVVRAAVRTLQYPLSQQGFRLRVAIDEGLPPFRADRDALERALLNLLTNAMKYSGESREIELDLKRVNGEAAIRVTDHGIGIPREEQGRIFEKFYRVPSRENQLIPGTGLGLTLVAHIVESHGGRVRVESEPGKGSTFEIRLPAAGG